MRLKDYKGDVMALPDWVFGQRWFVGSEAAHIDKVASYGMSEEVFPERCVVWGVLIKYYSKTEGPILLTGLRMGNFLPVNDAEYLTLEPVFRGLASVMGVDEFSGFRDMCRFFPIERKLLESKSQRLIIRAAANIVGTYGTHAALLISSLPKEVPDWLYL